MLSGVSGFISYFSGSKEGDPEPKINRDERPPILFSSLGASKKSVDSRFEQKDTADLKVFKVYASNQPEEIFDGRNPMARKATKQERKAQYILSEVEETDSSGKSNPESRSSRNLNGSSFLEQLASLGGPQYGFNTETDADLKNALDLLQNKSSFLQSVQGHSPSSLENQYKDLVFELLECEKKAKGAWKISIDLPNKNDRYISFPTVQICGGSPNYNRFVITFFEDSVRTEIVSDSIQSNPDLCDVGSMHSPDGSKISLEGLKEFYDAAGVQRIAVLGSARVFPYNSKYKTNPEMENEFSSQRQWGVSYVAHVTKQMEKFFSVLDSNQALFTTVNAGWRGSAEDSVGVPFVGAILSTLHDLDRDPGNEGKSSFPPITIMPTGGSFDRIDTLAHYFRRSQITERELPSVGTYFEVDGVWGDETKYLVGLSTALLVFEPYGFWTNIELSNGVVQGKPVAVVTDANDPNFQKKYPDFAKNLHYIEKEIELPGNSKGTYRVYKDAGLAAQWINDQYTNRNPN